MLFEYPAVLETAVVATPDRVRGFVPKAFVVLKPTAQPTDDLVAARAKSSASSCASVNGSAKLQ